ncbi:site-specific integrase [Nonomuraea sp. NPDC050451]|uniref:site-specific integrase n=1 Tax=Nonomuraea sp. NPDC050451 TaxID=3364364 RepID=UPI00378E836B
MPAAASPSAPGPEEPSGDRSTVGEAVERFLASLQSATTRTSYARTLARLTTVASPHHPVADLEPDHYATVMATWDTAAAATGNRHLSALVSFTTWAQRQDLLATNPARRLTRRITARRGDRAIPAARL